MTSSISAPQDRVSRESSFWLFDTFREKDSLWVVLQGGGSSS
jgi:hypothetical protein